MPEGSNSYKGLAVPLMGESEIKQLHAATDMISLTGASGMTGDFIVTQGSTGTEYFAVDNSGNLTVSAAAYTPDTNYTHNVDTDGNEVTFGIDQDIKISWDGTDLDFIGAAKGNIVKFGTVGTGLDMWFYGSQAGARMIWDEGAGQLTLNTSAAVHTRLNMGTSTTPPTSSIAYGDLFIARGTSNAWRLGICTTGTTKRYARLFNLTWGAST